MLLQNQTQYVVQLFFIVYEFCVDFFVITVVVSANFVPATGYSISNSGRNVIFYPKYQCIYLENTEKSSQCELPAN